MNRKGVNLGLLVLVVLLTLAVYFEPGKKHTVEKIPLTHLTPEEIDFIRISDNRGRNLVLEKQQGGWQMTSPYNKPADEQRISQLLDITTTRSFSHFEVPKDRLAEFGLAPAAIHLQLNNVKLEIGGNESVQFRRYVRIADQIHLINNGYHHHLMAQADDYVRKAEMPTP